MVDMFTLMLNFKKNFLEKIFYYITAVIFTISQHSKAKLDTLFDFC